MIAADAIPTAVHSAAAAATNALPSAKDVAPTIYVMVLDNAVNLVAAIVILVVGWTLAIWVRRWIRIAFIRFGILDPTLGPMLASLARYSILAVTLFAVLDRFGVQMTSLIAVLGAAGIAVGLALQGTLANVASGIMILLLRPFRVGDMISILNKDGTRGTVQEIGLFRTRVTSVDYRVLSIPNADIFGGTIVNFTDESRYRIDVEVPVDHVNDIAKVRDAFQDVVSHIDGIIQDPAPTVGVLTLGEYSVTMLVRFWVPYPKRNPISWALREALHARMQKEGIAIAVSRQAVSERNETMLDKKLTGHIDPPAEPTPEAKPRAADTPAEPIRKSA